MSPIHPHRDGLAHKGPRPAHWLYSVEEVLPVSVIGELLKQFGNSLQTDGVVTLRKDLEVTPPDPCFTLVRYERTPKGHLKLMVELKWGNDEGESDSGDRLTDLVKGGDGS